MRVLVLDDDRTRHKTFSRNLVGHEHVVHVHTYQEAVRCLDEQAFDAVFFDHDLNLIGEFRSVETDPNTGIEYEMTGADVARHLAGQDKSRYPSITVVHSYNPAGAQNIVKILTDAGIRTSWQLFGAQSGLEIQGE